MGNIRKVPLAGKEAFHDGLDLSVVNRHPAGQLFRAVLLGDQDAGPEHFGSHFKETLGHLFPHFVVVEERFSEAVRVLFGQGVNASRIGLNEMVAGCVEGSKLLQDQLNTVDGKSWNKMQIHNFLRYIFAQILYLIVCLSLNTIQYWNLEEKVRKIKSHVLSI
jgi:hypothetical protein